MKKIRILVVDDNKEIANMIKRELESIEIVEIVGICYSDKNEIEMIEKLKPNIVITDLERNGIKSGLDIIKIYKKKYLNLKFLVVSAEDFKVEYVEFFDGFIKKPIADLEVIKSEIKKMIDKN